MSTADAAQQAASHTVDAAVAGAASKTAYASAGMTVGGWLLSSEFAVLFGMILGLASFCVQWFYKHRDDKRRQAEHAAKMGLYQ